MSNKIVVNIFILCYNESVLIPHTINHYRKYLPNSKITIYDNESSDNSVEIAKSMGCDVVTFQSSNIQNEYVQEGVKNQCWKNVESGWVLVIDMDEWICVTEDDLLNEQLNGTSILTIKGFNMIGESEKVNLDDIDLHTIKRSVIHPPENKKMCFLKDKITEMNYNIGAHKARPIGDVKYSSKIYINKHMYLLGLNFVINKTIKRYERTEIMRQHGLDGHYTNDINKITNYYNRLLSESFIFSDFVINDTPDSINYV
jgi:hypothetical protein